MKLAWGGEELELLPDRAVWWPARRALILADPHFGKAATFRSAGLPLPHGITRNDAARMTALVDRLGAGRLILLGDFFHARTGRAPEILGALARWRGEHPGLDITLVRGNHDRHAGDPPSAWRFSCVSEPWRAGPFAFRHYPDEDDGAGWSMAGHIHPAFRLGDAAGVTARLPCFHAAGRCLILPAFGSFTGLHRVEPRSGDRVFVVSPPSVQEVPLRRSTRRRPPKSRVPSTEIR